MYKKKRTKIRAIVCNWKTTDRPETGFSFSNRPKRSVNMPGCYLGPIAVSKLSAFNVCQLNIFVQYFKSIRHFIGTKALYVACELITPHIKEFK